MKHSCTSRAVAELLTQVGRLTHSRGFTGGLNPAQWMALRYFSQANESVATVMKFAEHYGSSRGTASQSISALVRKGYLVRQPSRGKKSSHVLVLTEAGRMLIEHDPINHLIDGIEELPDAKKPVFAESLEFLIRHLFDAHSGDPDVLEPSE
ncbi:MarR family winged helix-turn-helix transcriptional regulator [Pararhodospirillum photometricum]|nr:MarR family transcriptional regulator [Pararhodospirillum photometricum]